MSFGAQPTCPVVDVWRHQMSFGAEHNYGAGAWVSIRAPVTGSMSTHHLGRCTIISIPPPPAPVVAASLSVVGGDVRSIHCNLLNDNGLGPLFLVSSDKGGGNTNPIRTNAIPI